VWLVSVCVRVCTCLRACVYVCVCLGVFGEEVGRIWEDSMHAVTLFDVVRLGSTCPTFGV
jgi:hypothetical protein